MPCVQYNKQLWLILQAELSKALATGNTSPAVDVQVGAYILSSPD